MDPRTHDNGYYLPDRSPSPDHLPVAMMSPLVAREVSEAVRVKAANHGRPAVSVHTLGPQRVVVYRRFATSASSLDSARVLSSRGRGDVTGVNSPLGRR